jgi:crossover junction endodeoxyribonuclease RusA
MELLRILEARNPAATLFDGGAPDVVVFEHLPFPPTVNHYWMSIWSPKHKKVFHVLSADAKTFRDECILRVKMARKPKLKGFLRCEVVFYPPNNLRRDIDNLPKGLLDGMKHADVFDDDSQIRELMMKFGPVVKDGRTAVRLTTLGA